MTTTASGSRTTLTIDTQDEDVRIAAAALKDMREGNPPIDPTTTASASFVASRHERSHPSHSPSRRKHLLVFIHCSLQLSLNFSEFISQSLAARHAVPAFYCLVCNLKLL